jgi:hypothetical protein
MEKCFRATRPFLFLNRFFSDAKNKKEYRDDAVKFLEFIKYFIARFEH